MEAVNPRLPAVWWLIFLLCLLLSGLSAYRLMNLWHLNRVMADPIGLELDDDTPARMRFAKAHYLAAKGDVQEAQRIYNGLRQTEESPLRERVLYNLGTLYLQEAASVWLAHGVKEYVRASTLVDLAKENLRESLRLNSDNADARYNLEYAYRITPPPKQKPKADFQGTKASIFATMPGVPGGGP